MSLRPMEGYVKGLRVHVSHFGYHPDHPKHVVCTGDLRATTFDVIDAATDRVAHSGALRAVSDDLQATLVGDFSSFTREGEFYVRVGAERSFGTFRIRAGLWNELQKYAAMYFFGNRRIGEDNVCGNLGDFAGVRWDDAQLPNGEGYRYIGTAFCDGDDQRVFPSAALVVAQYCNLKRTQPFWDTSDWIYSQVRWGLDGALSFLDKDGILRRLLWVFPDNDSDNVFHSGDEKLMGDAFDQSVNCNEYGAVNREVVYASLLLGPAEAVATYRDRDPEFFDRVQKLCELGYQRIEAIFKPFQESGFTLQGHDFSPFAGKYSTSAWVWLSAVMYQITGREEYATKAVAHADMLLAQQQTGALGDDELQLSGWYRKRDTHPANPHGEKPEQEVMITPWLYQCLFRLLEVLPDHPRAGAWRESIRRYATDFLLAGTKLNAFGHTPMKVSDATSGLKRTRGSLGYQYFASVGRMFHQIGNAAYLLQAGKLLDDRSLVEAGWRQAQWFAGVNPLGIGCIYGLSPNMPPGQYRADTFGRCIYGGTKNGMTGDANDQPEVRFWEYYTYGSLNVLWLSTVIGAEGGFARDIEVWPRQISEAPHEPTDPNHRFDGFPIRLKGGFTYRFAALSSSSSDVTWSVTGEGDVGTIDADGTYTAPRVTEPRQVTITATRGEVSDSTPATILPAPARVTNVRATRTSTSILLRWDALDANCSGYTIWRRLPVGEREIGTIFERVWAVDAGVTEFEYRQNAPARIEFIIRAYHRAPSAIYGYGPASDVVRC